MNIFFLPKTSAQYYFNRHCVKIILEICQLVYTAHWILDGDNDTDEWIVQHLADLDLKPYKKTHFNHPTSKWVRQSVENYIYACTMGLELCYEYTRRYGKIHKSQVRLEWLLAHSPTQFVPIDIQGYLATENIPDGCTPIPLAMPVEYHSRDAIDSYRHYYIHAKKHVAQTEEAWSKLCDEWKHYH